MLSQTKMVIAHTAISKNSLCHSSIHKIFWWYWSYCIHGYYSNSLGTALIQSVLFSGSVFFLSSLLFRGKRRKKTLGIISPKGRCMHKCGSFELTSLRADEIKLWLTPSAKQRRNPCSGLPAVYPDLSTRHDWPVKKGLCFVCRDRQSGWRGIRNALPVIRWVLWGSRTRISALLRRRY